MLVLVQQCYRHRGAAASHTRQNEWTHETHTWRAARHCNKPHVEHLPIKMHNLCQVPLLRAAQGRRFTAHGEASPHTLVPPSHHITCMNLDYAPQSGGCTAPQWTPSACRTCCRAAVSGAGARPAARLHSKAKTVIVTVAASRMLRTATSPFDRTSRSSALHKLVDCTTGSQCSPNMSSRSLRSLGSCACSLALGCSCCGGCSRRLGGVSGTAEPRRMGLMGAAGGIAPVAATMAALRHRLLLPTAVAQHTSG
jgi:hypothetical protein